EQLRVLRRCGAVAACRDDPAYDYVARQQRQQEVQYRSRCTDYVRIKNCRRNVIRMAQLLLHDRGRFQSGDRSAQGATGDTDESAVMAKNALGCATLLLLFTTGILSLHAQQPLF